MLYLFSTENTGPIYVQWPESLREKNETSVPDSCNTERTLLNIVIKCKLRRRICDVPDVGSEDIYTLPLSNILYT
jgi:hypothetical protein